MAKFMYLYNGPATDMANMSEEQSKAVDIEGAKRLADGHPFLSDKSREVFHRDS